VLDPNEKSIFDGMVTSLQAQDPRFVQRIDRIGHPRHRFRKVLAITLWLLAPFCVVLGGWTGFFMAVIAVGYAAHLLVRRPGLSRGIGFPWSSPGRRPGASI
jgi:Protein of unknown function (DUF3040)